VISSSWLRFSAAAVLLVCAAAFLSLRSRAEVIPRHKSLAEFPNQVGDWRGQDQPLSAETLAVLGPGDFLTRLYQNGRDPFVSLYIAYFSSQRSGDTIHSPKNCLPGSGWTPVSTDRISLTGADGRLIVINRYILANGAQRLLALYWYQAHGRVVASEYSAKFYLVADAMRMNRTDGALVRILTPIENGGQAIEAAQVRAEAFAHLIIPSLDQFVPR
jgi:EpsI family protein